MGKTEVNWGLGPMTGKQADLARQWLAKRGVPVANPRQLLAVRLGMRQRKGAYFAYHAAFMVPAIAGMVGYLMLQNLPNVHGEEMTESLPVFFVYFVLQLATWRTWRSVDRKLAAHESLVDRTAPRQPWWKVLGGWYLTATAVTFVGGAALGVAMYVTTPARTYAWSWLGLLAVGALCTAVVLTSVVRAPVIAGDDTTRAVDDRLRVENAESALPAMYAVPVGLDMLYENHQPPAFTGWLLCYLVLAIGLQAISVVLRLREKLPPGDYGAPVATHVGDDVGLR